MQHIPDRQISGQNIGQYRTIQKIDKKNIHITKFVRSLQNKRFINDYLRIAINGTTVLLLLVHSNNCVNKINFQGVAFCNLYIIRSIVNLDIIIRSNAFKCQTTSFSQSRGPSNWRDVYKSQLNPINVPQRRMCSMASLQVFPCALFIWGAYIYRRLFMIRYPADLLRVRERAGKQSFSLRTRQAQENSLDEEKDGVSERSNCNRWFSVASVIWQPDLI